MQSPFWDYICTEFYRGITGHKTPGMVTAHLDAYRKEDLRKGVNSYYNSSGEMVYVTVSRGTDGIGGYCDAHSRFYYVDFSEECMLGEELALAEIRTVH